MAQTLNINIVLGASQAALTLKAQLVDGDGVDVGAEITTGFTIVGGGNYLFHNEAYPDDFEGGVKFINDADESLKAFVALNPGDFGTGAADDPLLALVPGSYASGTAGAALGRIGVAIITVTNALAETGDLYLIVGDTYTIDNGRAIEFIDDDASWPDLTDGDAKFYAQDLEIDAEITTPTKITVELSATETASLEAKKSQYALKVIFPQADPLPDEVITLFEGRLICKAAP